MISGAEANTSLAKSFLPFKNYPGYVYYIQDPAQNLFHGIELQPNSRLIIINLYQCAIENTFVLLEKDIL